MSTPKSVSATHSRVSHSASWSRHTVAYRPSQAGLHEADHALESPHLATPTIPFSTQVLSLGREPFLMSEFDEIEVVARGGFGVVSKARRRDEVFAIKSIRIESGAGSSAYDDLLNELRVLVAVQHPYVLRIFGICIHDDDVGKANPSSFGIVSEYAFGGTLSRYIRHPDEYLQNRTPIRLALLEARWLFQLACGLAEIHRAALVHLDLKPDNVFLSSKDGEFGAQVRIGDLGSATQDASRSALDAGPCDGLVNITMSYCAPEVIEDPNNVSTAADVFSFGIIAYELLTKRHAFSHSSRIKNYYRLPNWAPLNALVRDVPSLASIVSLVKACCLPEPHNRPETAQIALDLSAAYTALMDASLDMAEDLSSAGTPAASPSPPLDHSEAQHFWSTMIAPLVALDADRAALPISSFVTILNTFAAATNAVWEGTVSARQLRALFGTAVTKAKFNELTRGNGLLALFTTVALTSSSSSSSSSSNGPGGTDAAPGPSGQHSKAETCSAVTDSSSSSDSTTPLTLWMGEDFSLQGLLGARAAAGSIDIVSIVDSLAVSLRAMVAILPFSSSSKAPPLAYAYNPEDSSAPPPLALHLYIIAESLRSIPRSIVYSAIPGLTKAFAHTAPSTSLAQVFHPLIDGNATIPPTPDELASLISSLADVLSAEVARGNANSALAILAFVDKLAAKLATTGHASAKALLTRLDNIGTAARLVATRQLERMQAVRSADAKALTGTAFQARTLALAAQDARSVSSASALQMALGEARAYLRSQPQTWDYYSMVRFHLSSAFSAAHELIESGMMDGSIVAHSARAKPTKPSTSGGSDTGPDSESGSDAGSSSLGLTVGVDAHSLASLRGSGSRLLPTLVSPSPPASASSGHPPPHQHGMSSGPISTSCDTTSASTLEFSTSSSSSGVGFLTSAVVGRAMKAAGPLTSSLSFFDYVNKLPSKAAQQVCFARLAAVSPNRAAFNVVAEDVARILALRQAKDLVKLGSTTVSSGIVSRFKTSMEDGGTKVVESPARRLAARHASAMLQAVMAGEVEAAKFGAPTPDPAVSGFCAAAPSAPDGSPPFTASLSPRDLAAVIVNSSSSASSSAASTNSATSASLLVCPAVTGLAILPSLESLYAESAVVAQSQAVQSPYQLAALEVSLLDALVPRALSHASTLLPLKRALASFSRATAADNPSLITRAAAAAMDSLSAADTLLAGQVPTRAGAIYGAVYQLLARSQVADNFSLLSKLQAAALLRFDVVCRICTSQAWVRGEFMAPAPPGTLTASALQKRLAAMRSVALENVLASAELGPMVPTAPRELRGFRLPKLLSALETLAAAQRSLFSTIVVSALHVLGAPPVDFAFVALGASADCIPSLSPTLEFACLVDDDAEYAREFFVALVAYIRLKMVQLGETLARESSGDGRGGLTVPGSKSGMASGFALSSSGASPFAGGVPDAWYGTPEELIARLLEDGTRTSPETLSRVVSASHMFASSRKATASLLARYYRALRKELSAPVADIHTGVDVQVSNPPLAFVLGSQLFAAVIRDDRYAPASPFERHFGVTASMTQVPYLAMLAMTTIVCELGPRSFAERVDRLVDVCAVSARLGNAAKSLVYTGVGLRILLQAYNESEEDSLGPDVLTSRGIILPDVHISCVDMLPLLIKAHKTLAVPMYESLKLALPRMVSLAGSVALTGVGLVAATPVKWAMDSFAAVAVAADAAVIRRKLSTLDNASLQRLVSKSAAGQTLAAWLALPTPGQLEWDQANSAGIELREVRQALRALVRASGREHGEISLASHRLLTSLSGYLAHPTSDVLGAPKVFYSPLGGPLVVPAAAAPHFGRPATLQQLSDVQFSRRALLYLLSGSLLGGTAVDVLLACGQSGGDVGDLSFRVVNEESAAAVLESETARVVMACLLECTPDGLVSGESPCLLLDGVVDESGWAAEFGARLTASADASVLKDFVRCGAFATQALSESATRAVHYVEQFLEDLVETAAQFNAAVYFREQLACAELEAQVGEALSMLMNREGIRRLAVTLLAMHEAARRSLDAESQKQSGGDGVASARRLGLGTLVGHFNAAVTSALPPLAGVPVSARGVSDPGTWDDGHCVPMEAVHPLSALAALPKMPSVLEPGSNAEDMAESVFSLISSYSLPAYLGPLTVALVGLDMVTDKMVQRLVGAAHCLAVLVVDDCPLVSDLSGLVGASVDSMLQILILSRSMAIETSCEAPPLTWSGRPMAGPCLETIATTSAQVAAAASTALGLSSSSGDEEARGSGRTRRRRKRMHKSSRRTVSHEAREWGETNRVRVEVVPRGESGVAYLQRTQSAAVCEVRHATVSVRNVVDAALTSAECSMRFWSDCMADGYVAARVEDLAHLQVLNETDPWSRVVARIASSRLVGSADRLTFEPTMAFDVGDVDRYGGEGALASLRFEAPQLSASGRSQSAWKTQTRKLLTNITERISNVLDTIEEVYSESSDSEAEAVANAGELAEELRVVGDAIDVRRDELDVEGAVTLRAATSHKERKQLRRLGKVTESLQQLLQSRATKEGDGMGISSHAASRMAQLDERAAQAVSKLSSGIVSQLPTGLDWAAPSQASAPALRAATRELRGLVDGDGGAEDDSQFQALQVQAARLEAHLAGVLEDETKCALRMQELQCALESVQELVQTALDLVPHDFAPLTTMRRQVVRVLAMVKRGDDIARIRRVAAGIGTSASVVVAMVEQ
ncbi:serine/threonine protein kinase [Thecamonas trahens ATCC 50062]|uniref:Serine/threonine protein kinase n=1 Tax=Thecamonas trahens ATCC 50062 TaxID=461836 RepID=A0A0L0D4S9_THETB|nr:serine/threonine protein kinase [Thecamonas trahens ATCC 50062]KNC47255.1 serine/threonine protein kinase [Thecamonas trahens ATCC 50062]|eukprot:XP_013759598.1 serine/threonine protein kinase [Thecamonas trahens ATCC 50062]